LRKKERHNLVIEHVSVGDRGFLNVQLCQAQAAEQVSKNVFWYMRRAPLV